MCGRYSKRAFVQITSVQFRCHYRDETGSELTTNPRDLPIVLRETNKTAITSIMTSPTGMTDMRLRIAPQRGHVVAFAEIMPPRARHVVIRLIPRSRTVTLTS